MAKFSGVIGFALSKEESPGVWIYDIQERRYRGDILTHQMRAQTTDKVNDDITIENSLSVVADAYALENFGYIKYIVWGHVAWKVQSITINHPRIVLAIGGVYNGERSPQTP